MAGGNARELATGLNEALPQDGNGTWTFAELGREWGLGALGVAGIAFGPTAPTRLGDRVLFLPQGWGKLARHSPRPDLGKPPSAAATQPPAHLPPPARSSGRCAQLRLRRYLDPNACPKRRIYNLSAYQINAVHDTTTPGAMENDATTIYSGSDGREKRRVFT